MNYTSIKNYIDFFTSFFLLIFISPLFLITSFLILISMGWPIFFIQKRPGFKGKFFNLIKFRTMNEEDPKSLKTLPERLRISRLGRILRETSLDEIPELINILKGEMSFIGPRPLLIEYLPLYTKEQSRRHLVKPGLSGWAQINGRNSISWNRKFKLDLWYVDNQSFVLDLKIFLKSIHYIFKKDKINHSKNLSMPKFVGKN